MVSYQSIPGGAQYAAKCTLYAAKCTQRYSKDDKETVYSYHVTY